MPKYNIKSSNNIQDNYSQGLLPQRNSSDFWYQDTSCRSNLLNFQLSSENRRILKKTTDFTYQLVPLVEFSFTSDIQKQIFSWIKKLEWHFPISSVKKIFTNHIFNYLYLWKDKNNQIVAYSICYFSPTISHLGYVFYSPEYHHSNLPIRLVLQTIIDSQSQGLKYCYLGRFSKNNGYYKRNMPGFEYFDNNNWLKHDK